MNKQIVMFALSIVVLFAGAGALFYWYNMQSETDEIRMSTSNNTSYMPNTSPNTKPQTSTLEVQGATKNNTNSKNNQNQLPTPDKYKIYEEYSNSETVMYIDTQNGQGNEASSGSNVVMAYKGWLTTGELFDQTRTNENNQLEPFAFKLGSGQVIPGWDQGIEGMKEGGKRRLIIPSSLGYGPNGQGPIPPNAMLIFDVELLAIQNDN